MHGKESTRMVWRLSFNVAACLMLLCAAESRAGEGAQAPVPAGYPVVYPSVYQYEWTYHVAVMSVVEREYAVYAPAPTTHPVRWSYDGPVTRTERQKIGTYPEFTCKYFDFTVSNYCRTIWHDVYADLPYIEIRPQHVDVDVPGIRIEPQLFPVMYPQWTWKEVTLRIFLPAVSTAPVQLPTWSRSDDASMRLASSGSSMDSTAPAPTSPAARDVATPAQVAQARATVDAQRAATIQAMDEGQRSLDAAIASAKQAGADPAALASADGTRTDLYALRATLLEQRSRELARFDQVVQELNAAADGRAPQ